MREKYEKINNYFIFSISLLIILYLSSQKDLSFDCEIFNKKEEFKKTENKKINYLKKLDEILEIKCKNKKNKKECKKAGYIIFKLGTKDFYPWDENITKVEENPVLNEWLDKIKTN